ncbi:MAG: DUF1501 domain-containing protein [Capsulimonadaceae bacterium]|nr:DUF1501 domain-containing protein [Capsulimonadaceae bacterium]
MSIEHDMNMTIRLSRREAIRCGLYGAAGLLLADHLNIPAYAEAPQPSKLIKPRAKSVIQLWMWGGPSHLDTFDPKPGAGADFCGPFNAPAKTNVDGILINELMPELAKIANKYSIIRGMTHGNNGHETAAYLVQTGNKGGDGLVHPGLGAIVSLYKGYDAGYKGLIPPYVVMTQLLGRFSEAGFLGAKAQPFATGGDPNAQRFLVEGVIADGITDQRQRDRRELMHKLDTLGAHMPGSAQMASFQQCDEAAYDLILGDAGKVFDLSTEKPEVRDMYGHTTFGQSCLMARRLVERGVPFVSINHGGWDTHKENFPVMRRKLPELDKAMSALLKDLSDRGLLDSTVVWWGGEFGRTPRVMMEEPWNGGRSHWGSVFSSVVAGGGFQGGHLVGESNATGEEVKSRPVYPSDVVRSICELMGIDPDATLTTPQGQAVAIAPSTWSDVKPGGRLSEIMPG